MATNEARDRLPELRDGMPISPAEAAYRAAYRKVLQTTDSDSDPPSVLYHYTDAPGLLGILKTRELWATNALYMNDAQEVHHGHNLAREFIKKNLAEDSPTYRNLRRGLGYLSAMVSEQPNVNNYVVSFCAEPDVLSQWRAYADRGTGFAIGFDRIALPEAIAVQDNSNFLESTFPVVYGEQLQQRLLSESAVATGQYCGMSDLHWGDLRYWINMVLKCKHPLFREEKEWRLSIVRLLQGDNRPSFRTKDRQIVPYTPIKFRPNAVVSVHVGPTTEPELARRVVRDLLRYEGHNSARTIEISRVPLRLPG